MRFVIISLLLLVAFLGLTGCGSAHKTVRPQQDQFNEIKEIAVVVKQEKEFEVVYSRATADGTGAVLFGVAGAMIGASIDKGEDRDRAEQMESAINDFCCQKVFIDALSSLKQSSRFEKVDICKEDLTPEQYADYDAVVAFTIEQWGLRLVEQRTDIVSGFIEFDMKVRSGEKQKIIWDERHVVAGQNRAYLRKYMQDGAFLREEMTQTIQEAGSSVSNLLIYQ